MFARLLSVMVFALGIFAYKAFAQNHSTIIDFSKSGESRVIDQSQLVDQYLSALCRNSAHDLWLSNLVIADSKKLNEDDIGDAFEAKIYLGLNDKEGLPASKELSRRSNHASAILRELEALALVFGSEIHTKFVEHNQKLRSNGKKALSKREFLTAFAKGKIKVETTYTSDLKSWVNKRIHIIETESAHINYDCSAGENFLYREGSELAKKLNKEHQVLPISDKAKDHTISAFAQQEKQRASAKKQEDSRRFKHYKKYLSLGVPQKALDEAMASYFKHKAEGKQVSEHRMVVVDYTESSNKPRFWVLNLQTGNASGMKMGHGSGSGLIGYAPGSSKYKRDLAFVSSKMSSNASEWGAMIVGNRKPESKHDYALYLEGLDPHNKNVADRDILIHAASYVNDGHGIVGRSKGCFVLSNSNARWAYSRNPSTGKANLAEGTFLYAYKGDIPVVNTKKEARKAL